MREIHEVNDRTLTLQRTFKAPLQLVWDAWTQPEHIAQWWGPKGMNTKVVEHDFREDGKWKYTMMMPDGNEFIAEGTYLEIEPLKKIISSADFKPMTEGVEIQASFEAQGDETLFTFSVVHPTAEYCQQQEKMGFMNGWGSTFARLQDLVEAQNT